jgi:hypothetical protein
MILELPLVPPVTLRRRCWQARSSLPHRFGFILVTLQPLDQLERMKWASSYVRDPSPPPVHEFRTHPQPFPIHPHTVGLKKKRSRSS